MNLDALHRLAELAGIEEGWWDFFGRYRQVPAETKQAFLAAMGFAVATEEEIAASLEEFETRPWRRWLEPVLVSVEKNGPPEVVVTVPQPCEDDLVAWTVEEECGTVHRGKWCARDLPVVAERDVGGLRHRRHVFRLPGTPMWGVHRLRLAMPDGTGQEMTLIVVPARAYLPDFIDDGGRLWGYATQLYALRSERNWGVGDFTDLAELGRHAARHGAAAVGVNPLHALFANRPERFSPYSPSSRVTLNVAYIDVEAVPDFRDSLEARRLFGSPGFQARLAVARNAELVHYDEVGKLKFVVLEACWKSFSANHLEQAESERGAAFRQFQREGGRLAERFATFEALQEFFLRQNAVDGYWRNWPKQYQDPDGAAVAAFAQANRRRVEFFWYLQWLANIQLATAQEACSNAGMPVGIYRDLGVGIADDGAEAWANQSLLCLGVSVGAPPDPLNLAGQDWGLAPFNPLALREAAYQPFLQVLEANMDHAGAMRLDHAMSLQRLYWVPRGARADQGAYVRYPVEEMFALVVLASARRRCLVIGEDLGTVPDGFRQRMEAAGLLGYRLMVFEKDGDRMKRPAELTEHALVAFGTHDLPSLAGWWQGMDVGLRRRLELYPDPAMGEREAAERAEDRRRLVAALAAEGLLAEDFSDGPDLDAARLSRLAVAIHAYLGRSPAKLLMAQFEDALGLALQMNLPGTTDQHPNWRSRYPMPLAEMLGDRRVQAVAEVLRERAWRQG